VSSADELATSYDWAIEAIGTTVRVVAG
jgi:hypothetical protein